MNKQIESNKLLNLLENGGVYLLNNITGKAASLNIEKDEIQFFESCAPGPMSDPTWDLHDVNDQGLEYIADVPKTFEISANGTIVVPIPEPSLSGWIQVATPHTVLAEVSIEELESILDARRIAKNA